MQQFQVVVRHPGPSVEVVQPTGVCDMDTAGDLAIALDQALGRRPRAERVLVDCHGVEFCASAGLNELLRARQQAVDSHVDFRLSRVGEQMSRLLEVTGADKVFTIEPSLPPWAQ